MLPETQKKAYRAFYDAATESAILDKKTRLLLSLASAMAFACYP